jgi:hypothetical protein
VSEPPIFDRTSQNIVVAAMLLRNMPEPSNPEARWAHDEIRGLLETAAMQQAESSASRRCSLASEQPAKPSRQEKEASVHPEPAPRRNKAASVRERIVNNREP